MGYLTKETFVLITGIYLKNIAPFNSLGRSTILLDVADKQIQGRGVNPFSCSI